MSRAYTMFSVWVKPNGVRFIGVVTATTIQTILVAGKTNDLGVLDAPASQLGDQGETERDIGLPMLGTLPLDFQGEREIGQPGRAFRNGPEVRRNPHTLRIALRQQPRKNARCGG